MCNVSCDKVLQCDCSAARHSLYTQFTRPFPSLADSKVGWACKTKLERRGETCRRMGASVSVPQWLWEQFEMVGVTVMISIAHLLQFGRKCGLIFS